MSTTHLEPHLYPDHRYYEPLYALEQLHARIEPKYPFAAETRKACLKWQRDFKAELGWLLGFEILATHLGTKAKGKKLQATDCGAYTREFWEIELYPGGAAAIAFVLVPKGVSGKSPAIVAAHGHGACANALAHLDLDGNLHDVPDPLEYHRSFAMKAVARGYVVLIPEIVGFGNRDNYSLEDRNWSNAGGTYQCTNILGTELGVPVMGLRAWDIMRQLDWFTMHPAVDGERIGMWGISGGGTLTSYVSIFDDRIKASSICGYLTIARLSYMRHPACPCWCVPGSLLLGELDDIAALLAPKPLLMENGKRDWSLPMTANRQVIRKLRRAYDLMGGSENFEADFFDGGHWFHGEKTWQFFARHLAGSEKHECDEAADVSKEPGLHTFMRPAHRRYEPVLVLEQLAKRLQPKYAFKAKTKPQWTAWRRTFKAELGKVLGFELLQEHLSTAISGRKRQSIDCDSHTREFWQIRTLAGRARAAGFVLVPKTRSGSALVMLHGHNVSADAFLDSDLVENALARGYVVFIPEQTDFGCRTNFTWQRLGSAGCSCGATAANGSVLGVPAMGLRAWDVMRQIEWFINHPAVDADRIGLLGLRGGGMLSALVSVFADCVPAVGVSGCFTGFGVPRTGSVLCDGGYVPGLRLLGGPDDMAALIAPKPALVLADANEPDLRAGTKQIASKMGRAYEVLGKSSVPAVTKPGSAKMWRFFEQYLMQ